MKIKFLSIILCGSLLISCDNIAQLVQNVSNEVEQGSERIEEEIQKSTDKIKNDLIGKIDLNTINEILNTKHLDNIENVALKVVEYQNIVDRISNLQENFSLENMGAAEVLAITQFTKSAQTELLKLKEQSQTKETTQKIDSLLNNYQNIFNNYNKLLIINAQNLQNRNYNFENENENENDIED